MTSSIRILDRCDKVGLQSGMTRALLGDVPAISFAAHNGLAFPKPKRSDDYFNRMRIPDEAIRKLHSVLTVVDGKVVHTLPDE